MRFASRPRGQGSLLGLRLELDIVDVDHRALEDRPRCHEGPGRARRIHAMKRLESSGVRLCVATIWSSSPSNRKSVLKSPSHNLTALLTIVSKTGCTSVGDC